MPSAHEIFEKIITDDEFSNYRKEWNTGRTKFSISSASIFFIFVMIDQGMKASRASKSAKHFVDTNFPESSIWEDIANKRKDSLKKISQKGFDGTSYPPPFMFNTFHIYLKENAKIINDVYDGDPRKIWNVSKKDVDKIYTRFTEFHGIGDALAKMAQFILVRDKGVAGGIESKQYLSVKPDIHVNKVLFRMGLTNKESASGTIKCIEDAEEKEKISSQADLDLVLFKVGREFCSKSEPNCNDCPLTKLCKKVL